MALFMDVYTFARGPSTGDLVRACQVQLSELAAEGRFGASYLRYWVSEPAGKVFCLVEAEDPDLISTRHGHAPGEVAHEIYPVSEHIRRWPGPGPAGLQDPSTKGG
jgi:hypothetical protein